MGTQVEIDEIDVKILHALTIDCSLKGLPGLWRTEIFWRENENHVGTTC